MPALFTSTSASAEGALRARDDHSDPTLLGEIGDDPLCLDARCAQLVDPAEYTVRGRRENQPHPAHPEQTSRSEPDAVLTTCASDYGNATARRCHGVTSPAPTTTRPPTMVSSTTASPRSSGVTKRGSRSSTVMSAVAPGVSTPPVCPIER